MVFVISITFFFFFFSPSWCIEAALNPALLHWRQCRFVPASGCEDPLPPSRGEEQFRAAWDPARDNTTSQALILCCFSPYRVILHSASTPAVRGQHPWLCAGISNKPEGCSGSFSPSKCFFSCGWTQGSQCPRKNWVPTFFPPVPCSIAERSW